MKKFCLNHYEKAFQSWLIDSRIPYITVDEQKKLAFGQSKIKSFDYLLYPSGQKAIIAEVKGRKFKGTGFAKLSGFECWVTLDDVEGLMRWQEILANYSVAAFFFAYKIENIDVDFDGREVYEFDGNSYIFFCIKVDDYCSFMKKRSKKWRTVTLPAKKFRECAIQMQFC